MESIDTKLETIPAKADANQKSKTMAATDRVSIGRIEADKLGVWLSQIQTTSKGFLDLTKSDLINFLIRDHKVELTPKELSQIRADNYDPVRHINWITQALKIALAKKDFVMVASLQEEIKSVELSFSSSAQFSADAVSNGPQPPRKRSQKKEKLHSVESPPTEPFKDELA